IPSYNRAHIISRAIQGVLDQTFQDFEIVIVDDGSTDNTKEILQAFTSDNRIKSIYQTNAGVCSARNTGAKQAEGEFLIFLDSDDTVEKSWLEDFYDLAIQNKEWLFCSMKIVKPDSSEYLVSALDPYRNGRSKGNSLAGSWAIKKDIFLRVGLFDENMKFGENVELRFRLDSEKLSIGIIDNYNFTYFESLNGGSRNLKNTIDSNLYIIKKHSNLFNKRPILLRLYYQNIAVAYAKLGIWNQARIYFWKAYITDMWKLKTLARFVIALFPLLGKKIWKQQ
ncbi:glycosyltransferase family 2 protein, partial [Flavobacterium sp.]|uniref:glycosyltransferase family 2 protein n=1 Tax=Flavobacterium sp. TaxID=239 RepID=UPI0038FCE2FF